MCGDDLLHFDKVFNFLLFSWIECVEYGHLLPIHANLWLIIIQVYITNESSVLLSSTIFFSVFDYIAASCMPEGEQWHCTNV